MIVKNEIAHFENFDERDATNVLVEPRFINYGRKLQS
jgi:hypothetical protein